MNYYLKALQNYANFSGRARRKEYWMFYLINFIIALGLGFLDRFFGFVSEDGGIGGLGLLYQLFIIVPGFAIAVRRMHDVGKSGWFCLIPIYNLILAATEGEYGANEYGPDPKNTEARIKDYSRHLVD